MSHDSPLSPPVAAPLCLIYLPPILANNPEAELDVVGAKLAVAIDRQASVGAHVYRTVSEFVEVRGKKEKVCRILRMDPAGSNHHPLADIFMVDYRPGLLRRYRDAILAKKCVLTGIGLCEMVWRTMTCEIGRGRHRLLSLRERVQSVVVLAILALFAGYLTLMVVGGVSIARDKMSSASGSAVSTNGNSGTLPEPAIKPPKPEPKANIVHDKEASAPGSAVQTNGNSGTLPKPLIKTWTEKVRRFKGGVLRCIAKVYEWSWASFAVAGAVTLTDRGRLRELLIRLSEELLAFVYYLSFADRRAEITGEVDDFVEGLVESGPQYQRFAVMGYSFGSVVALDVFCPPDGVRARRLDHVDTLITIGSPHDFILTYWADYFANRDPGHRLPATWLNIYSPIDVLSSQFEKTSAGRADASSGGLENSFGRPGLLAHGPTEELVFREHSTSEELTLWSLLCLRGLRAHSLYWSPDDQRDRNCFHLIAPRLFPEETAAPPPPTAPSMDQ
jgi:hypothetical protein